MGTILLSAFCALALNAQSAEVKKDTIDKYVIDKQVVERFDGTQLEGKTISKYIIAYKDAGNVVEKTHVIYTGGPTISIAPGMLKGSFYISSGNKSVSEKMFVIVDGKEMECNDISQLKTEEIASVEVYKAGSKVAQSYGEKGKNGVLWVTTKANKTSENIYFIDGRRAEKSEMDKLSPDNIESMSVNKKDGNSVIEVRTKK